MVAARPQAIAVRDGDTVWTYAELDARADAIAARLQARGIGRGALVGLHGGRSAGMVAAILGVLRAGAAYLPFDPAYPPAQRAFIAADAGTDLHLRLADAPVPEPALPGPMLELTLDASPLPVAPAACDVPDLGPDDRAYVMYTSGSTGTPKGVQIAQRGILRLVLDTDYAAFGPEQRVLHLAPLAFDASTFELWAALLHGAELVVLRAPQPSLAEIADALRRQRITTCWLTAGLFHLMVEHELAALGGLHQLLAGGDVLSVPAVDRLLAAHPRLRLINGYGPTENTTFSCCHTVRRDREPGPIPIGRPIRGCEAFIVDDDGAPVAPGEIGELWVGGPGVAIGYLNRPGLDAERFLPHPRRAGERVYRSGDRVRQRPDGVLEFHGRSDRQVKIAGHRIELDGLEALLLARPDIRAAAVLAPAVADGDRRIAVFVEAADGAMLDPATLRAELAAQWPAAAQPQRLERLPALPLSPTGKIDRRALEARLALAASAAAIPVADDAPLAERVRALWLQALGRRDVGDDDNFFDVGGSSLLLIRLHAALAPISPRPLALIDLYRMPRLGALLRWLEAAEPPAATLPEAASDRAPTPMSAAERARLSRAGLAARRPGAGR